MEETDNELSLMDDSPKSTTEEEFGVKTADTKVLGIVESDLEENRNARSGACEEMPDVTTLLENWRTKMLKG